MALFQLIANFFFQDSDSDTDDDSQEEENGPQVNTFSTDVNT